MRNRVHCWLKSGSEETEKSNCKSLGEWGTQLQRPRFTFQPTSPPFYPSLSTHAFSLLCLHTSWRRAFFIRIFFQLRSFIGSFFPKLFRESWRLLSCYCYIINPPTPPLSSPFHSVSCVWTLGSLHFSPTNNSTELWVWTLVQGDQAETWAQIAPKYASSSSSTRSNPFKRSKLFTTSPEVASWSIPITWNSPFSPINLFV